MRASSIRRRTAAAIAVAAMALIAQSAQAALFRAYLSSQGIDSNPCTIVAPCRLLPAALAAVQDEGEIWMLDAANYNTLTVNISKSVTILAVPGTVGSVVSTFGGGDALHIFGTGIKVTLRNLVLRGTTGGVIGVNFAGGAQLTVEDCEVFGMPTAGILASAANSKVVVTNTIRDIAGPTGSGIRVAGALDVTLDHLRVLNNTTGIMAEGNASGPAVSIANTVISGNGAGISAVGGGILRISLDRSVLSGNDNGVDLLPNGNFTILTVSHTQLAHNSTGIHAEVSSASKHIYIDGNVIAYNGFGVRAEDSQTATLHSFGNNSWVFNGSNVFGVTSSPEGQF